MEEQIQKKTGTEMQADRLVRWDRILSQAAAENKSFEEVMDTGKLFLPYPYAFASLNLEYRYATKEFIREVENILEPGGEDGPIGLANFAAQDMLLDRKYHEAAKETSVFYYYSNSSNRTVLCCNLFVYGKYYARMLMSLPSGQKRAESDEEALFLFFCRRIENLLVMVPGFLEDQPKDSLHSYLSMIGSGKSVPESILEKAAESAGIRGTDDLSVIILSMFSNENWDVQYEIILPYLAYSLEVKWKYSCAVPVNNNLVWLVDLNRSEANPKSRSFYQELAFFLRENICKAGVSSRFRGFDGIVYAVKQAEAALSMGNTAQPSFWYYLFDDYRLYYMLERAGKEIPFQYLLPAPVQILKEYDREKNAELCKTLLVYLRNNQNDSHTAEQLHVHRTTLFRRLERIYQLTGLSLDHPDTVLELLMTMRMIED